MRFVALLLGLMFISPFTVANEETSAEAIYLPLTPQFTVNLLGDNHYLRTSIQLQLRNDEIKESIEAHNPAIRHALIVLLSNNYVKNISSGSDKIELQNRAVQVLNTTLKKYAKKEGVEAVFFTEFVSQ